MNILFQVSKWYFSSKKALPYWGILLLDSINVMVAGYAATYITMGGLTFAQSFWPLTLGLLIFSVLYVVAFRCFHTYASIVRFSSFVDLQHVALATITGLGLVVLASFGLGKMGVESIIMPNMVACVLMCALSTLLLWIERVFVKRLYDAFRDDDNTKKVFIYGVHAGGVSLAKSIQNQNPLQYKVVGFVTPDEDLYSKYLMGVLVHHDGPRLVDHMREKGAEILIVSPLQADHFSHRQELINDLLAHNIKIMMLPPAEEWDGKSDLSHHNLREVEIEDLLPREKIEVDMGAIGTMFNGKRVLITGAAGSIGSEIVRQVAPYKPAEMILVDQAETPMHDIRLMMARQFSDVKNETVVASITDKVYMEKLFSEHRPEYVFHAAAYKHVPMMEDNPAQAVRNNVNGTCVIADLAVKYGTKKFVMISTDKAVNPTNVMGCSKRICEIYCQALNKAIVEGKVKGNTQFVTTRFGNVLGSNGSVIPLFREQIKKGGPLTVTHPDIIRFFMLISEACKLVLEAGTMGKGGEIFVFDMGEPVKIVDLAKRMITLSGVKGIDIKFTGLRDGEKLYEEVLNDAEGIKPTHHPKIMIANVRENDYEVAKRNEDELLELSFSHDDMAIVKKMKEIVPEFKTKHSKYEVLDKLMN